MEKQIILTDNSGMTARMSGIVNMAAEAAQRLDALAGAPLRWLGGYYSMVLERPVSLRQTRLLNTVQLTFFATVLPADYPLLLRCAACVWFIASLLRCRKEM